MTDATTIHKTIFLKASRETVWSFLTDREKLGTWFHRADADLREGQEYTLFRIADDGEKIRQIWGRVIKASPPETLTCTFLIDPLKGAETTVTWVLEEAADGTRLSLTHTGIAEAAGPAAQHLLMALDCGWDDHLGRLRESAG
jgi:uncharacterized protein YndB with AHSA1/START domain